MQKTTVKYHIFATGFDDWFDNEDDAQVAYDKLGDNDKRFYSETYDKEGELIDEDCLDSYGAYPA